MSVPAITYDEACRDPNLFGPWFDAPSWATWGVIDKALFGVPLDGREAAIFTELTGRKQAPTQPATEAWFIVGRRGGKDVKAASIAVYLATFGAEIYGYRAKLSRGERGVVQVLAVDRDQARVCLGYVRAFFEQPIFARMVVKDTSDGLELKNGLSIEITTNDRRRVRGRTVVAAIFDEVAFWRAENTINPDDEVYAAVKPSMATIPGAMLIGISSPYARRGLLWKKYRTHWGKPGNVLVVKAPTWRMNPTLPRDGEFLTQAFADDPASAAAEFGAEFRSDIEELLPREAIDAVTLKGVVEREPQYGRDYQAFVDPSGGSADSMTLAVGHVEDDHAHLDALRERRPPFSPEQVVADFAALLASYHIRKVSGDRYAGEWPREQFRKHGIDYEVSTRSKSEIYRDFLPIVNSRRCSLLDSARLTHQLDSLERSVARGGRDTIDHPPNGHDDLANAAAGVIVGCLTVPAFRYGMLEVVS